MWVAMGCLVCVSVGYVLIGVLVVRGKGFAMGWWSCVYGCGRDGHPCLDLCTRRNMYMAQTLHIQRREKHAPLQPLLVLVLRLIGRERRLRAPHVVHRILLPRGGGTVGVIRTGEGALVVHARGEERGGGVLVCVGFVWG